MDGYAFVICYTIIMVFALSFIINNSLAHDVTGGKEGIMSLDGFIKFWNTRNLFGKIYTTILYIAIVPSIVLIDVYKVMYACLFVILAIIEWIIALGRK